ncbi:hypothetical protein IV203_025563 [Nitzschia inconspicua]|uniref:Uncharacterized protein n=1 Tax=Nitzschia inconspicua TaxID=303405 RepID=A0A9K3LH01_9STRA|nr:hypothetical protein IV203_017632 [Nitzschia inconspicua]KAG7361897.1 hypothetical protein IV203_025563 [Nitzschia inconspicua]
MEKLFVGLIPTAPDNFPTGICRQWVGDQVVLQPSETSVIYIQTCQQQYNCHPSLHELLESQLSSSSSSSWNEKQFGGQSRYRLLGTGRTGNRHKNKQGVNTPWGGTFSTAIVPVIDPTEWHTGPYCQVYIAACESATRRGLFQRDRKRWTAAGATAGGRDEDDAKCTASIDGTTREMTDTTDVSTNQMLLP